MSESTVDITSARTSEPVVDPDPVPETDASRAARNKKAPWKAIAGPLASLKLTVWLLALSIFLTFAGTLAQIDMGIWAVMEKYFRTPLAWIDLYVFFPRSWEIPANIVIPFPGGQTLGALLLINLLAAHAVRFTVKGRGRDALFGSIIIAIGMVLFAVMMTDVHHNIYAIASYNAEMLLILLISMVIYGGCWLLFGKRAGLTMLHAGLIFMLLSEVITTQWATEGTMTIPEGATVNFTEDSRAWELAVIDTSGADQDRVTVIPASLLDEVERTGTPITHPDLPFDLVIEDYMLNSDLVRIGPNMTNPATTGDGLTAMAMETDVFTGAGDEASKVDIASTYATIKPKGGGEPLGTYLLSGWLTIQDLPQEVTVGGKTYEVYLRFVRSYKPFSLTLDDFEHEKFLGTSVAKDYRSHVVLNDPEADITDRKVEIYMNHPLRHSGYTFFQSSFLENDSGTILQVVDNPGRLVPYIACFLVAVGLVGHFFMHLIAFGNRRARS